MFSRTVWEKLIWISFCFIAVFFSFKHLTLGEDACLYLTTGKNFLETGQFFYFINWPLKTIDAQSRPYLDYPPGMPLLLAFLFLWVSDPLWVAILAQTFFIVAMYLASFFLFRQLKTPFSLQLWIILVLTFQKTFIHLYTLFVSELFFLSIMLGCGYYALKIYHEEQEKRAWKISYCLLFCGSLLKFVGIFNVAWFIVPILCQFRKRFQSGLWALAVAFLPFLLWTLRHRLFFSELKSSHEFSFDLERFSVPFLFFYEVLWQFHGLSSALALFFLILVIFSPFYLHKTWNSCCTLQLLFLSVFGTHFLGTLSLSLFIVFDPLQDRLLAPSIVSGLFAVVFGLQTILEKLKEKTVRFGVVILPFLLLLLNVHVLKKLDIAWVPTLLSMEEKQLGEELAPYFEIQQSSHFYSEYNFRLQLFIHKTQNILWFPTSFWKPDIFQELIQLGRTPFFLLPNGSVHQQFVEVYYKKNRTLLQKIELLEGRYLLYLAKQSAE